MPTFTFFRTNAFISSCSFGRLWSSAFSKIALNSTRAIDIQGGKKKHLYMSQFSNWGWAAKSNESGNIRTQGDSASPRRCFSFASDTCFYALVWWKSRVSVPPIWVIQVYVMGVDTFIDWRQVISIDVTLLTSGLQGERRRKHVLFTHLLQS